MRNLTTGRIAGSNDFDFDSTACRGYLYVHNSPTNYTDPSGLKPGEAIPGLPGFYEGEPIDVGPEDRGWLLWNDPYFGPILGGIQHQINGLQQAENEVMFGCNLGFGALLGAGAAAELGGGGVAAGGGVGPALPTTGRQIIELAKRAGQLYDKIGDTICDEDALEFRREIRRLLDEMRRIVGL